MMRMRCKYEATEKYHQVKFSTSLSKNVGTAVAGKAIMAGNEQDCVGFLRTLTGQKIDSSAPRFGCSTSAPMILLRPLSPWSPPHLGGVRGEVRKDQCEAERGDDAAEEG